ncbi:prolyl 3-hydroxylase 1 isoform X2 [Octopus sinensis]|uniref:procollagen-proline 3-dioxygenase n=1 Tax=Octopus sinensis TaxID=2607531 RepID=A0A6P7SDI4_9MOLL|nr:prolyl 3-hydroxylase 1 isoform X2 [Octopus sinensis]
MAIRGLILGFCLVNIAQILAIEPSSDTYDLIYSRAREAYSSQGWVDCVKHIKDALKDYKFYRSTLISCRRECRGKVMNENETSVSPDLENMIPFFFKIIKVSNCVRMCKQKNMPNRPDVSVHFDIEDDFEMRMPYDYLQFCHYKRDNVKEAVAAAYTYLMADAKQDTTVQNLMFYQQFPEVDTSDFVDLERRPYQAAFIEGQENQRNGEWKEGVKLIEEAINEFIKEEEECRILCEGPYDHESFPEFINAISEHFISVLKCQNKCEGKLSILHGEKVKDFFPELYNYLQFGYYKLNDIPNAVKATASYLVLKPDDPTMLDNKQIYIKSGITPENIIPRPEALKYFTRRKQIKNILQYVTEKYVVAIDDEGEIDDSLKSIDLDSMEPLNHKRLNENHYLHIFEKYGLKIMAEPNDLFEPYRLVVDGFVGDEQCQEMINLVTLQKTVDGMKTLTVPETVEKMNVSEDYNVGLRLLLRMSGIAKQFIQKYLNHNIYHYSTKVICKDKWNGHCFLTESGKCLSEFVPEGSFQSITHLSSIPKAGGSYFAKPEEIIIRPRCGRMVLFRSTDPLGVKPFNESEMERCVLWNVFGNDPMQNEIDHLDALILLRNMDQQIMLNTSESRSQVLNDLLNQGVEVVSTEKEMLGKERFIADGLASKAECETLIDLANAGGSLGDGYDREASPHSANEYFVGLSIPGAIEDGSVRGDGYKHQQGILSLISPHTKHELFQGLTVARAAKLVKEGTVSFDAVSLFLKLAEKGRLLVEKYLNLTKPLYFDFTHLVCRTAVDEDELDRSDLSHPIHADNCLLQPDGTCLKEVPAYIQRDYSAIIYLNGEFTGGEFIFAYPNKSEQLSMKPKCGRLVGFNAADYHGVKAVIKGQRCCLAMWYTQDPDFKELAHSQAHKILKQVKKERQESEKSSSDSGDNDSEKDQPNSSDSSTDISSKEKNTDSISNKNEEL